MDKKIMSTWMGTEESLEVYLSIREKQEQLEAKGVSVLDLLANDDAAELDEEELHWMLEVFNNIGIIRISGPMVKGTTGYWGRYFGYCGYNDIIDAAESAKGAGCETFLFIWDTGGGSVEGLEEASDYLRDLAANYDTTSFTASKALSAGCWLSTCLGEMYGTPMSSHGSVGVIGIHREFTEAAKMWGEKFTVFRSAPHKALGSPYEKLSEEASKVLTEDILKSHEFFVDAVTANCKLPREFVAENIATGDVWYAQEAIEKGLLTGIKTLQELLIDKSLKIAENESNDTNNFYPQGNNMATNKLTKSITSAVAAAIAAGVPVKDALVNAPTAEADTETDENTTQSGEQHETSADANSTEKDTTGESNTGNNSANSVGNTESLSSLISELVSVKVALANEQAKNSNMAASHDGMKKVVAVAFQRAQVAMGGSPASESDLMALDASVLLSQYAAADAALAKRFPVGGRVSEVTDESGEEDKSANTSMQSLNEEVLLNCAKIGK